MKKRSTIFLQAVIVGLSIGALILLLWEPRLEGVNANATNFEIYFKDPFLALVYLGSVPFFAGLYQAFRLLGYVRQNNIFSEPAVKTLRMIKKCALVIIVFVMIEEITIMLNHGNDDPAGAIALGLYISFLSVVIAAAASVFESILQSGMDLKSKNDIIKE